MKAFLMLEEIPENCIECPVGKNTGISPEICVQCGPSHKCVTDATHERPGWCPLQMVPDYKKPCRFDSESVGYAKGWNDCIRMLEGGKKKNE